MTTGMFPFNDQEWFFFFFKVKRIVTILLFSKYRQHGIKDFMENVVEAVGVWDLSFAYY